MFAGHDGGVTCGLFSRDGKNVCSGGEDGSVRVWAPKTGACKHVFGRASGGHQAGVTCLVDSADGEMLLSGTADTGMLMPPRDMHLSLCILCAKGGRMNEWEANLICCGPSFCLL